MAENTQVREFPSDSVESQQHWRIKELEKQAADREAFISRTMDVHRQTIEARDRANNAKVLELQEKIFELQATLVKANTQLLKLCGI